MIVTSLRCLFIISGKAFYHQKSGRTIYSLAALIPSLSLSVRRYHDTGLSGWWFVGLYVVNLVIEWTTSGLVWSVIGLLVSIVMLIITLLPTNHFLKQAEE